VLFSLRGEGGLYEFRCLRNALLGARKHRNVACSLQREVVVRDIPTLLLVVGRLRTLLLVGALLPPDGQRSTGLVDSVSPIAARSLPAEYALSRPSPR